MASQYDVKFLAAAIKASYLSIEKARELFDLYSTSGGPTKHRNIALYAQQEKALSPSQIDILLRVVGEDAPDHKEPRKRLGPYEVIEKLGEGGMGVVVKGRHIQSGDIVAIKVLPRRLYDDPEYIQRFIREAANASKLNHPNIMRALGAEKTDEGLYYYIMEFIDGESVQQILDRQSVIPESQVVAIAIQSCRGLQHAHEHGMVHRDIKPENIMISRQGTVKLTDLGLAKEIMDTNVTQTGIALGTPHYMSPEQARGDRTIDIRSDLYSLGASMYHMLTGTPPFVGNSAAVVITKHLVEKVPSPKDIRPETSEAICTVIATMMAKEQNDRYATPEDTIQDLERVARGEDVVADMDPDKSDVKLPEKPAPPPPARPARATRRKPKEHKAPTLVSTVLTLIILGLIAAILFQQNAMEQKPGKLPGNSGTSSNGASPTVDEMLQGLRRASAFERKYGGQADMQDAVVQEWERFLDKSRGTKYERQAYKRLLQAKTARQKFVHSTEHSTKEDPFKHQLEQAARSGAEHLANEEYAAALSAFDELSKLPLSAGQSQQVVREQRRIRDSITEAVTESLPELEQLLDSGRFEEFEKQLAILNGLGIEAVQPKLDALKKRWLAIQEQQKAARASANKDARIRFLGHILFLVQSNQLDAAISFAEKKLHETGKQDEAVKAVLKHLLALKEMGQRLSMNAASLVGTTRKVHGIEGKVTAVGDGSLIVEIGARKLALPFTELSLRERAKLSLDSAAPEKKRLSQKAIFWFYHRRLAEAAEAVSQAGDAPAEVTSLKSALPLLAPAAREQQAEQLYARACQELARQQWDQSRLTLAALQKDYDTCLFLQANSQAIRQKLRFARREGRPPLFQGDLEELDDGTTRLTYDFQSSIQLGDWFAINPNFYLNKGLRINTNNWLVHRAKFDAVKRIKIRWHCDTLNGSGLSYLGWGIELDSLPGDYFDFGGLQDGLFGRFFSRGETSSNLWQGGTGEVVKGASLWLEPKNSYCFNIQRTEGTLHWSINGDDFLRIADLGDSGGRRLALVNHESSSTIEFISIQGKLDETWLNLAEEQNREHLKALNAVQKSVRQKETVSLLDSRGLPAWRYLDAVWGEEGGVFAFRGGLGTAPSWLDIELSDAKVRGLFQYPDEEENSGWRLGLRQQGLYGYFIAFSPRKSSVRLIKILPPENGEPGNFLTVPLGQREGVQFIPGTWHQFEVHSAGEQIQVFLDKEFLFLSNDPSFAKGGLSISGLSEAGPASPIRFKGFRLSF